MASVCIWLWVGGLFCSVAFLSVDVGVWFAVFCTAAAFTRSMGDLLRVLLAFDIFLYGALFTEFERSNRRKVLTVLATGGLPAIFASIPRL